MTKITAPVEGFDGLVAGAQFIKGVAEVPEDFEHIRYFVEAGYTVGDQPAVDAGPAFPDGEPSEDWKGDQIKAYASANGFDLAGATNKKAMVEAIVAAKAAAAVSVTPADAGSN